MTSARTWLDMGRGLLSAACALVLLFQLMASAMAGSNHIATKFRVGEIALTEICGTTPASKSNSSTHVEGVNACCVWAKSVAPAPLMLPALIASVPARTGAMAVTFDWRSAHTNAGEPDGPPKATGPPLQG
ncbi:hypothetical protein [Bosea beijingensis]|uniref:hypothetical protein n=1 Tax=Bosea beijingensis TaxID=3068632 RepID=UPI0027403979|nr:hypothetical protein [Bosea sp. REN20]